MTSGSEARPHDGFACLAIETASGAGSVAACVGARTGLREYPATGTQSRDVFTGIREVLEELSLDMTALDCIAFSCGPGAFTGLRVGAAVAQSLAYALGIPVARVSSLAACAARAQRVHAADCVVPCFDARMGEVYLGAYRGVGSALHNVVADRVADPERFRLSPDLTFFAAGPGWSVHPNLTAHHAGQIVGADTDLLPTAADILALAAVQFAAGETVAAPDALPNYIRDQVTDQVSNKVTEGEISR